MESMLGEEMETTSVKWKNNKVSDIQELQASQGKTSSNSEGEESEGRIKSRIIYVLEAEHSHQNCVSAANSDVVDKKMLKRLRILPVTRNNEFLWTSINKNILG